MESWSSKRNQNHHMGAFSKYGCSEIISILYLPLKNKYFERLCSLLVNARMSKEEDFNGI